MEAIRCSDDRRLYGVSGVRQVDAPSDRNERVDTQSKLENYSSPGQAGGWLSMRKLGAAPRRVGGVRLGKHQCAGEIVGEQDLGSAVFEIAFFQ